MLRLSTSHLTGKIGSEIPLAYSETLHLQQQKMHISIYVQLCSSLVDK